MYNTGNAGFLAAACSFNREVAGSCAIMFEDMSRLRCSVEDLVFFKITSSSVSGKMFMPGSFVASRLELDLNAMSDKVSAIDFKTKKISGITMGSSISVDGSSVLVPLGNFYPENDGVTVGDDGKVSIKALDIPPKLDGVFSSSLLTFPCTIQQALTKMSSAVNISLSYNTSDFPNLSAQLSETFSLEVTYREAFRYFAEVLGAFAYMGRNGELCLKKAFNGLVDIGCVIDEDYWFTLTQQESKVQPFEVISIKANKEDLGVSTDVSGVTTGCEYSMLNNPLTYGHPEDFLAGLVSPLSFTEFYPTKLSFQGRPDIDLGDVITYGYKGSTYILPVCSHVLEYNGGFKSTIESIGTDSKSASVSDSGFKSQIEALKQNIHNFVIDLEQTKSEIIRIDGDTTNISTLLQTAESLSSRITEIEGNLEKSSSWEQTAEGLSLNIETIQKGLENTDKTVAENQNKLLSYFDFKADGLIIGTNSSNVKLRLGNDKIQFLKDGAEVAYLSDGKLYVTDAHFLNSLVLGNFEFVPRSNGNLSLRRRG